VGESRQDKCRRIVRAMLAKQGWQLEDPDTLANAISQELAEQQASDTEIQRATIRHYCVVLHTACSDQGSARQRRAFEELWNYLYPMALYRVHNDAELAEDMTQQALEKTWKNLAHCRNTGSFLSYSALILINEIRQHFRKKFKREANSKEPDWFEIEMTETALSGFGSEDEPDGSKLFVENSGDEALLKVMGDEAGKELLEILQKCLKNPLHRAVLNDLFFDDKVPTEVASAHGITVDHVFVCRNRGLKALRQCDTFIRFLEGKL
jgi:RNA polymerase sigma factor (sigma-70 family)